MTIDLILPGGIKGSYRISENMPVLANGDNFIFFPWLFESYHLPIPKLAAAVYRIKVVRSSPVTTRKGAPKLIILEAQ